MAETMEEQRPSFNLRKFYEAKDNSVASVKMGMPYLCECQGNGAYRILVLLYGDFTPLYSEVFLLLVRNHKCLLLFEFNAAPG